MDLVALTTAFLAALISAALALAVRWWMDERARRISERQLAYVHYLSISEFLAGETILRKYVSLLGLTDLIAKLKDPSGKFESTHKACVLLADSLCNPSEEERKAGKNVSLLAAKLRMLVDSVKTSSLKSEQLSKLPKDSIETFIRMQSQLTMLSLYADQWISYIEHQDTQWVSPEALYEQWFTMGRFLDTLRECRDLMINSKVVTREEADALMVRQLKYSAEEGFSSVLAKPKLDAALSHFAQKNEA